MSKTENDSPEEYAALFIDVQNISHQTIGGHTQRHNLADIKWPTLVTRMFDSMATEDVIYMGQAYTFAGDGRKHTQDWLKETLKRSFVRGGKDVPVSVRMTKDIDSMIVSDIWDYILGLMQIQHEQKGKPPLKVTILLAGGDGVYAYPVKGIRRRFSSKLIDLRLHTFSWSESLSQELTRESNYIEELEKGVPIIR